MWVLRIRGIEESSVYQAIYAKGYAAGRAKAAREILVREGRKKLGESEEQVMAKIGTVSDLERLHLLLERVFDATSWDELLASADQ